ncbi:MAG: DUF4197 domain-containing protein [Salinisphaera sp.]|nr:DUF4197 domain-containing protein [Salinisphaera sp.]
MIRRQVTLAAAALALASASAGAQATWTDYFGALFGAAKPSQTKVVAALRQTLKAGADSAVSELGQSGGYWHSKAFRIPLPPGLQQIQEAVGMVGESDQLTRFQHRLNHAAQVATAEAGSIFQDAISHLTLADAYGILRGPDDAATVYLRKHSNSALRQRMVPIVREAIASSGAARAYEHITGRENRLSSIVAITDFGVDLVSYVTDYALDRIFKVIAHKEAAIRAHPGASGNALLREVFSS